MSTRVFSVSLGGFDFHADEKPAQERILGQLDTAVAAFVDRMRATERGRDVVVLVYSEFGRRVRANASDGTDHGTASNVFVLGPRVAGGRLIGEQPSLTDLDDGDLKATMDFRDVYAAHAHRRARCRPRTDPRRLHRPGSDAAPGRVTRKGTLLSHFAVQGPLLNTRASAARGMLAA